jgi:hypothetical protein
MMRLSMIALGAFAICGAAVAEPPKAAPAKPAQTQARPTQIVLASAEQVRGTSPEIPQANSAPAKRRTPRVTTCRCGDPQANPENQEQ